MVIRHGVEDIQREWRASATTLCGILYALGYLQQVEKEEKESCPTRKRKPLPIDSGGIDGIETPSTLLKAVQSVASSFETTMTSLHHNNHEDDDSTSPNEVDFSNLHALSETFRRHHNTTNTTTKQLFTHGFTRWMERVAVRGLVSDDNNDTIQNICHASRLVQQLTATQQRGRRVQTQLETLQKERDQAVDKETRIRRGLHRIAAGRWTVRDAMKDIQKDGVEDLSLFSHPATIPEAVVSSSSVTAEPIKSKENKSTTPTTTKTSTMESSSTSKRTKELEAISECRKTRINELTKERESLQKRINDLLAASLVIPPPSPALIRQTDTYLECAAQLVTSQRRFTELETRLAADRLAWSVCRGELDQAHRTLREADDRHAKRWRALTERGSNSRSTHHQEVEEDDDDDLFTPDDDRARVQLRHRLQQALEGVRQVEAFKVALTEASKMNDCLRAQVAEWRSKYTTLSAKKSSSRELSRSLSSSSASSSAAGVNVERLKADFRACRKELSSANQARENYKAKNERLEKDRDYVMKTNVRLIKQSTEKEEMNTKSLSTILQLRHVCDLRTQEVDVLQQKVKAAEQLALAARLVQNAHMRVKKEEDKTKEEMSTNLTRLRQELDTVRTTKDRADTRLSQSRARLSTSLQNVATLRGRCDELAAEGTAALQQTQTAAEALAAAQAPRRGGNLPTNSSDFSVDQLSTHLNVLKKRLACAVCNDRDKEVILLRCRHMFCKHCIDENIKNRSRKCPACGQRFDTKDVGDVWL